MLKDYLKSIDMSVYKLAKTSGVPYTTVLELTKNKTNVNKATVGTVMALANTLNVDLNQFINICSEERQDFEFFKSSVSHMLKRKGDMDFIIDLVEGEEIKHYFKYGWYQESLYLLALLDSLSEEHGLEKVDDYDEIRSCKLDEKLFPKDVVMMDEVNKNNDMKNKALESALQEFLKYNIVETNFRKSN